MNPKTAANLRKALADLYPDEPSLRRVASDAGLDLSRVSLTSSPLNNWHAIWTEAEKINRLDALLNVIAEEYGDNKKFRTAYNSYRGMGDKTRPLWIALAVVSAMIVLFGGILSRTYFWGQRIGEPTSPSISAKLNEPFETNKFGIAVASFNTPQNNDGELAYRDRLYNKLMETISSEKIRNANLLDNVEVKKIGLIHSMEEGAQEGTRLGAKIVLWGQIFENEKNIEIHFQVLETSLFTDDPMFPRAMPIIDPSLHICATTDKVDNTATMVVSQEILGLASYSLGLYYYLNESNPKLAAKQFNAARTALEGLQIASCIVNEDPKANLGLVYYYLGKSYQQQGRYTDSLALFEKALKQNRELNLSRDDSAILLGQMYSYRALGQESEKLAMIQRIIQEPPQNDQSDIAPAFNRALAYEAAQNYPKARQEYEHILDLKPDLFIAHLNVAKILTTLDYTETAQSHYTLARHYTAASPIREAWLHLGEGQWNEAVGQTVAAIQAYSQAIELAPNFTTAYLDRARLYEAQAANKEARSDYEKVVARVKETSENPGWAYIAFGQFLYRTGNYTQAVEQYQKALYFSYDPLVQAYKGQAYAGAGDEENALKDFQSALQNPGAAAPVICDLYGHALVQFGHTDEAIAQFKRSIELSQDPVASVTTQLNLGQVYSQTGNIAEAKKLYESVLGRNDKIPQTLSQLAQERLNALPQK